MRTAYSSLLPETVG